MVEKQKTQGAWCGPGCCQVEAIITMDERGQMVLPKDAREKAGIKPGDKLAVVFLGGQAKPCCIMLMKTDELSEMAKNVLGPLVKNVF